MKININLKVISSKTLGIFFITLALLVILLSIYTSALYILMISILTFIIGIFIIAAHAYIIFSSKDDVIKKIKKTLSLLLLSYKTEDERFVIDKADITIITKNLFGVTYLSFNFLKVSSREIYVMKTIAKFLR